VVEIPFCAALSMQPACFLAPLAAQFCLAAAPGALCRHLSVFHPSIL
jgi:hypothetical protein